jgi:trans-aconitate 2-methyltransferase
MNQTSNHYTFGENDLAARRLAYLAAAYELPTRAFVSTWGAAHDEQATGRSIEHAIDLGCGPGHTTALVHEILRPRRTTGLDASDKLLLEATSRLPNAVFVRHDVTLAPFPCPPGDLLFCRFLLTHLHDTGAALRAWAAAATPGAHLLIQETESLASDEPVIQRYYELVGALQAGYGQSLHVGVELDRQVEQNGWEVASSERVVVEQDASIMSRLHAMNIRTWSQDAMARRSFDPEEILRVQVELDRIASGERSAACVRNTLRQIVAARAS